jgi:hypothetical protein
VVRPSRRACRNMPRRCLTRQIRGDRRKSTHRQYQIVAVDALHGAACLRLCAIPVHQRCGNQHAAHLVVPGTCSNRQTAQPCEGSGREPRARCMQTQVHTNKQTNKQLLPATVFLRSTCIQTETTFTLPTDGHCASPRPVLARHVTYPHSQQQVPPGPN